MFARMTRKCFDYKALQSLLGVWHHASVNASLTVKLMTSISWRPRHASSPTIDDVIAITDPPSAHITTSDVLDCFRFLERFTEGWVQKITN